MKKLGFGLMRLPLSDPNDATKINQKQTEEMVDYFLAQGYTYFDTAYMYHSGASEKLVKEVLVKRHPRDSFSVTSKLPTMFLKNQKDQEKIFCEQQKKCGVDFFDYYLLHSLNKENYEIAEKFHSFEYIAKLKKEGAILSAGFSFHDTAQMLDKILTEHPEMDFVQLQINYLDWDSEFVQSRLCYETAVKHGKKVIVMEPVKGGTLATVPAKAESLMRAQHPDWSIASWALRFVSDLPAVFMILSGMSNLQQVKDNIHTFDTFSPLSAEEVNTLQNVVKIIQGKDSIACTGCHYCTDGCPKKILIPDYFSLYNTFLKEGQNQEFFSKEYENISSGHGKAGDCIACRKCEKSCPQHLPIVEDLKKVKKYFE